MLDLNPQEIQVIWNALMKQPAEATYAVLRKMQQQMTEQGVIADDGLCRPVVKEPQDVA